MKHASLTDEVIEVCVVCAPRPVASGTDWVTLRAQFGPIHIITVKTGGVRICYANGRVKVLPEGRYAFNSGTRGRGCRVRRMDLCVICPACTATFVVCDFLQTQQQVRAR